MKLLDVADVQQGVSGSWGRGHDEDSRECAVDLDLVDACDPSYIQTVVAGGNGGVYSVMPFGILANLQQPVNCWRPDDEAWLQKVLAKGNELALTRALIFQPVADSVNWVGADDVIEVAASNDLVADLATAWTTWHQHVLSEDDPIIHVSPGSVGELVKGGLLMIDKDKGVISAYGAPVVVGVGYSNDIPPVFVTGKIDIRLSSVELAPGDPVLSRRNWVNIIATQVAEIDLAPCTVVRVGPVGIA